MFLGGLYIEREPSLLTYQLFLYYQRFFYSPTDAQVNCLKNNTKMCIKIDIKTAPICFGTITPSSGSVLFALAKVIVIKIIG